MMSCLFLYLLTTTLLTCGAQEYYVTPTPPPNPNCPSDKLCHTLDYYANNASGLINGRENVSLLFIKGYHYSETIFEIANVDNFTITGLDLNFDQEIASTTISSTQMLISNGTIFTLKNIAISDTFLDVSNFKSMTNYKIICNNSILTLIAAKVNSVLLTDSSLHQCLWSLYWGYADKLNEITASGISTTADSLPLIEISNTNISSESETIIRSARSGTTSVHLNFTFCSFLNTNGLVINAHTVGQPLPESNLVITMDHCYMTDDMFGTVIYANNTHNVHVDISDSHFTAFVNGSRTIQLIANGSTINATVQDSDFLGGLGIDTGVTGPSILTLTVRRCKFMQAKLDSFRIFTDGGLINVLIDDCQFKNGFNSDSTLLFRDRVILAYAITSQNIPQIVLRNSLIIGNNFLTGIIVVLGSIHMTIDNCTIKDNSAITSGGLLAFYSNITLKNDIIFENNTGSAGGAMYLFESQLTFTENLNLVFLNNKAKSTGGAIFVTEAGSSTFGDEIIRVTTEPNPKCFYQLETDINNNSSTQASITFINNTALTAGNNIYGAALKDECTVTPDLLTSSYRIQDSLFDVHPLSPSSVSSSPRRVCVCENGEPKCTDMEYIFIEKCITPGEKISIEVILVGYDFGPTVGDIFATELQNATNNEAIVNSLGEGQEIQHLDSKKYCTTVNYSVRSIGGKKTTFILTSSSLNAETIMYTLSLFFKKNHINESIQEFNKSSLIRTNLLYTPVFISVDLLPCPFGLEINNTTGTCECRGELLERNIATKCTVKNGKTLVTRKDFERLWFRIHNNSNHGLVFEYARRCIYAYCNNSAALNIDPNYPDSQCALNHTGVLCGGCAEGLSLAIGSSRCLECPDNLHLSLILVFLLLGIVLVLFIWILDLTISRGTINGLLFYVNMVSINREIFFVENTGLDDTLNNCLKAAQLFIDWCNLDFGIESCFIYQLNATGKTWLQFLFPLYVWILAGLIIVACKYSTRLTKLFGNNSVSVLLTLFLIAYMKLVRTVIFSFAFADIQNLKGQVVHKVWYIDGNVHYDDIYHVILCLISGILAICLFAVTVWLILIRFTLKLPKHHRINPILDSFIGRLKKNHEYWIGLSLIVRVILSLVTILLYPQIVLQILIIVLFIFGLLVFQVYKRIYLSLIEAVFLINLLIVSSIFLGKKNNQLFAISISVSVLISALMFMGICIYHGIKFVQGVRPKVASYIRARLVTKRKIKEPESEQQVPKPPTLTVIDLDYDDTTDQNSDKKKVRMAVNYSTYREELLDSNEL